MTKMIALVVVAVILVIGSALMGPMTAVNVFGDVTVHKQTQGKEQTGPVQILFHAIWKNGTTAEYNSTEAGDTDKIDPQKGDVIVAAINAIINGEDINLEDLGLPTTEEEKEESSDGGGGSGPGPSDPGPQENPQEVNLTNPGPGIQGPFVDCDGDGDADVMGKCPTQEHDTCQGHPTCEVPPSPPEEGVPAPEPPKDPNPEPEEQVYGLINCNGTFYYRSDCPTGPNNAT